MSILRTLLVLAFALSVSAFQVVAPAGVTRAAARAAEPAMFSGSSKSAPKKAPKKAAPKKSGKASSTEGKGGIFPWVTNTPGTYAKPLMLSSVNFLGDDGDSWIGWGFMPQSVKKLYNPNGKKGLL